MRHVFQFYEKKPTAGGSGKAYIGVVRERPRWRGFQADLIVVDTDGHGSEGDALYLEGDGESLLLVLQQAISVLKSIKVVEKERVEKVAARAKQCRKCWMWHDPLLERKGHSNGKGKTCKGS